MPSRGQTLTVSFVAWDNTANVGKAGDAANFTLRWVKDGTSAAPTNIPATEVDATNAPGLYKLTLTGTECTCDFGTLAGKSSTSGISILPISVSFEQLPTAAPNANGGLPILSNSGTTLAYTISTLTTYTGNTPQTGDAYARIGAAGAGLTAVVLAASGLDSVAVESGLNARQAISIIAAACAGLGGTTSNVYKGAGVATTRISFTASAGERSSVTLSPPA
jgi:hypothetical protein